jgi:eukaryotic-like serine/threonine-protein kinase
MSVPDRLAAALADRYRIVRELGQGGMATVYLAEDLKHGRNVALKVLKPELAAVLGAERFVVEIRTTAALQHPHILPLFDSGTADGFLFYVMPFIDGETLRSKLDRETQLGVDEAVKLASDVADALHYAHEHGVIHRDIKPENILLANGRPMVADFGIALAVSAAAGGRMTETGLSLGTPHYMSPEQATAEKEITRRSDVYSLASVLYEMLAGNPPHVGSSAQQIIMKIITEQPASVTALRKSVPSHVAAAVAKALEKLPADRFATAAEFAAALADRGFTTASMVPIGVSSVDGRHSRRRTMVLSAALVVAVVVAVVGWLRGTPPGIVRRFDVILSRTSPDFANPVLAPEGGRLAYSNLEGALQLREPDVIEPRPIPGSESSWSAVFSPDGSALAVNTGDPGGIKVLPLDGGVARVVVSTLSYGRGLDWTQDGWIYFLGGEQYGRDLMRVRASGGPSEFVARPDSTAEVFQYMFPQILPGGRILVTALMKAGDLKAGVVEPKSGGFQILADGIYSRYSPTGHLIVASGDGALRAARFDPSNGQLVSTLTQVADGMAVVYFTGTAPFSLTTDGTLAYQRAPAPHQVVRVSRDGRDETLIDPEWRGYFRSLALSPDETRLAIGVDRAGRTELWVRSLESGAMTRLSSGGVWNYRPTWSRDGRDVIFTSDQRGKTTTYRVRADGSSPPTRLLTVPQSVDEALFSRDGAWLVYRAGSGGNRDIFARRTSGDTTDIAMVASAAEEFSPALSPDGRWLAYASEETGRTEVYVRPFPDASAAKFTVSRDGGSEPLWNPAGGELFFRDANDDLIAVSVAPGDAFRVTARRVLFSARSYRSDNRHRTYTVTNDGSGFLFIKAPELLATSTRAVVTLNWFEELKRLVGR